MQDERLGDDGVLVMRVGLDGGIWPDDDVVEMSVGADGGAWSDDTGIHVNVGAGIDDRIWVDGIISLFSKVAMNVVVGVGVADVEPVAFVEDDGAEFVLSDQIDECGDDGDDFLLWDEWEDSGFDAVDAGELVGTWGIAKGVAHVGDLIAADVDVAVRSM